MEQPANLFNIRVYGIVMNEQHEVLLTDEFRLGMRMTKFPGGGLNFGEGTLDCLRREFREEMGQEIEILSHFYTTDYFQQTRLLKVPQQLISIYYFVRPLNPVTIEVASKPFDFENTDGAQCFRWVKLDEITEDDLTFPIDQKVIRLLKEICQT